MNYTSIRHHVVIGDGLAAAEFAKNTSLQPEERLTIVGPNSQELGRGLAYSKVPADCAWHMAYLLNSPSEDVDPGFARWMHSNWESIAIRMADRQPDWLTHGQVYISQCDYGALNAPRELFGDYLCSSVNQTLTEFAEQGVIVQRVTASAIGLEVDTDGQEFNVQLETGESLVASHVDVATGGAQTQSLFAADGLYSFNQLYGHEAAIVERVKQGGTVVCLGTNAAMLDALRLCQSVSPGASLNFLALSPSAQLPEPLIPSRPRINPEITIKPQYKNALDLIASLSQQMDALRQKGFRMADMRGPFKAAILDVGLDNLLVDPNEARKVLGLMERLFLRGTRDSLLDFRSLQDKNQVQLIAGQLSGMQVDEGALRLTIAHANGAKQQLSATALINCSGAGTKPRFDSMTELLLEKSWLTRCPITGGLEVGEKLNVGPANLRYLSPGVTVIDEKALAFSLYDATSIRALIRRCIT